MRNLKKVLSLALALVMLVGMMVVGAGATSFADDASIQNQEAVSVLAGLGVVKGREDGSSFDPTGTLTRAEAAMMIAQLDLGVDAAAALKANGTNPFTDVAATHWAAGAIDYCVEQGYIRGDGNGHFFPGNNVTGVEFGIMLTSLLGYDSKAEGVTGSEWQTKGAALARRAGLTNGVAANTADMTRDGMAQMAFNALTADMVEYVDGTGTVIDLGGIGTITTGAKATKVEGTGTATKDYRVGAADDDTLQLCEAKFPGLRVTVEADAFGVPTTQWFVGKKADSVYNADDVIAKGETSGVLATYTDDVGDVTKGQLVKLGVTNASKIYENGTQNGTITVGTNKFDTTKVLTAYKGATVYVMDGANDADPSDIYVVYGYLAQVTKVTEASSTRDRSINLKVYRDNTGTPVSGYVTEGFEKDQWVMVYPTGKKIGVTFTAAEIAEVKAVADADMVMGSVTKVDGTNGTGVTALTVDSKYAVGGTGLALMAPGTDVAQTTYSFSTDYTLFLSNGYVIGVSGEESTADIGDIVYVTRTSWPSTDNYGVTTNYTEVVNMDGTTAILPNIPDHTNGGVSDPVPTYAAPSTPGFYTVADKNGKKEFTTLATVAANGSNITDANPFAADTLSGNVDMTEKTTSIVDTKLTASSLRAYVTSGTRLLFIGTATGADLKVTLETGAMKQTLAGSSKVLLSKNSAGNLIVEAIILGTSKVDVNGEVVYVKASGKTGTDSVGDLWTIYKTDGTKDEIHVAKGTTPDAGFATYSVDDKGVHTFSPVAAASTDNGDGKYALSATPVSVFTSSSLISTTGLSKNLTDADASEATVIDLTGGEDTLDLNGLNNKKITGAIFVRDGKVESIVVTTAAEKSKGTAAKYVSEALASASTDEYFEVALGGITVNVASNKTAVNEQAEAWKDAYSKTDWTATVSGAKVTLTCDTATKYSTAGDEATAKAAAGVTAGTFTQGDGSNTAAKIELTLAQAVATTSKVKVTISSKDYYVAKSNNTKELQLAAWKTAYNADAANEDYTADVGADANAGKIVLTAKAVGVKNDSGTSTNVTVGSGTWTDGTAAE